MRYRCLDLQWYGIVCDRAGHIKAMYVLHINTRSCYSLTLTTSRALTHETLRVYIATSHATTSWARFRPSLRVQDFGSSKSCAYQLHAYKGSRLGAMNNERLTPNDAIARLLSSYVCMPVNSDVSANFLAGAVPDSLSLLVALRVLRLDNNWFIGRVPASLGQLTLLEHLYVRVHTHRHHHPASFVLAKRMEWICAL